MDPFLLVTIIVFVCCIIAYLLGSLNFAIIFTKLFKGEDIRTLGSGNAGFTNVLRSVGVFPAILTLILDFSKGIISVLIVRLALSLVSVGTFTIGLLFAESVVPVAEYIVCFFALLGHLFPIYYGFKGGKGILVTWGCIMALSPLGAVICLAVFLVGLVATRYVSVGSIMAAASFPIVIFIFKAIDKIYFSYEPLIALLIAIIIIYMHRANIKRLINHTENKISIKKVK